MKHKIILLLLIIFYSGIVFAQDSSIAPINTPIITPHGDTIRLTSYIKIQPYNVIGDTAYYVVLNALQGDVSSYISFDYYLMSSSGNRLYSSSVLLTGGRFAYIQMTCLLPTCRLPYIYWLIINLSRLHLVPL